MLALKLGRWYLFSLCYEANAACDKHAVVLETVVTPGNVHDSAAFDEVHDKVGKSLQS